MEVRDTTRPLSARSVIASTLLGVRPARLPARALVRAARLLGIAEGTARTALSRMVAAGEVVADGGAYELAGPLRARQERQDESRQGTTRPWDGEWAIAVVGAERRAAGDRVALRDAMRALRKAELRAGVWLRPDNLDPDRLPQAAGVVAEQCVAFRGRPAEDLVPRLWDLAGWAAEAERYRAELDAHRPGLGDPEALAPGFVLSAAVLRHLQADPLLPGELLPAGWPGPRLRASYEDYDAAFKATWRVHATG